MYVGEYNQSRPHRLCRVIFFKNISRTSAVRSTNFGSILIFASCVVGTFVIIILITRADLMLGRWPATNTCLFSGRTAYTVPSLALRRAGLPSCASQPKSDGHQLPCGGPLPERGTTTLNSFASKQTTGYAAFGSRRS